ncbi:MULTISPECIES: DNA methyltransferase [unclassified Pseudoalteromonas]|uniref:DNA methyltransferase n=1 Tax=unclassified Pseudoalteromonas TaxID=194690 RepID=UPI0023586C37|nr:MULTISPECIES: DNA methyltransferase [unclassified Pseudoalteromonas]MDC9499702.1 DNA methyltransferase [Pseudoalteromonas sp. Angola-20]MDC9519339.1 DNA methyltransferase [Pseudoalteromonas sp. Angola-22]MDC9535752.1 DNA methyltransferase [Pseudoalteromonas sp. Angola-9]
MSKYNELVKKLKEIFQIDRPELDFGIYRILNAKADEINNYLENTLKQKISDALATAGNANKEELEKQLLDAIKGAEALGVDPESIPKVKDLRQQIITTSQGANEHENAVFTHLLSFFSRYYDSGDFVSKRRYKGDTYAIPYAGEEVMLHWANKDQYYIKSGENFANYSFKLDDGRKVSFKLLAADTAKDNRKDNDADRRFVLIEPHTRTKFDEDGNEYDEEYQPVTVVKSDETEELVIQFEYKTVKKGTKQDALVTDALQTVLSHELVQSTWADITKREPTEKNLNRTLLEKHLTTYTQRNTADYFIHKDLGGFLSNELDFYIKNEVMNLDNVQNAEVFADIEKQLRMIQCLRSIAGDLIKFLAQLENFQKKLWEKKKFIVSKDYITTTFSLSKKLVDEVYADENFVKFSIKNHFIESRDELTREENVIDTSLLNGDLRNKVINHIENEGLDISGELINADNFQALNQLKKKYFQAFDLIYIDPPYNTGNDGFHYKDGFKNSSWITIINQLLNVQRALINEKSSFMMSLDEVQFAEAKLLLDSKLDLVNLISVKTKVAGVSGSHHGKSLKNAMEYMLFYCANSDNYQMKKGIQSKVELMDFIDGMESEGKSWKYIQVMISEGSKTHLKTIKDGSGDPIEIYVHKDFEFKSIKQVAKESHQGDLKTAYYQNIDKVFDTTNAQTSIRERVMEGAEGVDSDLISINYVPKSGKNKGKAIDLYYKGPKRRLFTWLKDTVSQEDNLIFKTENPGNLWADIQYNNINKEGDVSFDNGKKPVSLLKRCIEMNVHKSGLVLDYFSGSGTTGDAVVQLNREDGGSRKFIIVEQGEYFDEVTKLRMMKSLKSAEWSNGKVKGDSGIFNQTFKVIKLESYEDTLNNLEMKKTQTTGDLFDSVPEKVKSDYLLNYMLETESKGSLLSTDDFKKPFDYKMKIAVDSAGASEEQNIDLVETFNYLIGLQVKAIESNLDKGYVRIEGKLPSGERALVLWRDCEKIQYDDFTKFANRFDLFARQKTFDVIYVNGDHNLPTAFTNDEDDVTRTLKLRQIEPEFLEQMFAPDELA